MATPFATAETMAITPAPSQCATQTPRPLHKSGCLTDAVTAVSGRALLHLHANFGIDLSATDVLSGLVAEAEKTSTEVLFAELQDPARQMFRRCGLLDRVGKNRFFRRGERSSQSAPGG